MDFPPDIVQFIERRFAADSASHVYQRLSEDCLSTPRVMRAVLYLSNGSISLFDYFAKLAKNDIRELLVQAEYETQVAEHPMWQRDLTLPFTNEDQIDRPPATRPRQEEQANCGHHQQLANRKFVLGEAQYTVLASQPLAEQIFCRRRTAGGTTVVKLPLAFVAEQFAEEIELSEAG